ncbi:slipin family protein [Maricaulis parjimensis]|uniref:slipin family protein n=1 Tax=Maricaulis parjimensis TaxID=144023 RepID=UPI00193A1936|nr:slipin family protein [Maricaulis parjimensis]
MIYKTAVLAEHERGVLLRDQTVIDLVGPGRHRWLDLRNRLRLEIFDTDRVVMDSNWANRIMRQHADLAGDDFILVRPDAGQLALIMLDGAPYAVVTHGMSRAFWTVMHDISVEMIELAEADRLDPRLADRWAIAAGHAITKTTVGTREAGLLYVDGELREQLAPGRHAFWAADRAVRMEVVDLRETALDVVAQEVLTKDRVTIRLNLTAFTRVTDPMVRATRLSDADGHVYKLIQFAAREAVAGRTLDVLLRDRVEIDREITDHVRERLAETGMAVSDLRIKDVILPGDMREMLNKVVEAEKAAEANLIRRREETAATRSLLNTARLMDDHPGLMRLKELEALERLTEKVGRIDVHQTSEGAGLPALLDTLMGRSTAENA